MLNEDRWTPIATGTLGAAALDAAREVAVRLSDPESSIAIARTSARQSQLPSRYARMGAIPFHNVSIALLFAQLDGAFPNEGWDRIGHTHLASAVRALESQETLTSVYGLFAGTSSLAFTVYALSRNGSRYSQLLSTLDTLIVEQAEQVIAQVALSPQDIRVVDYDLISGPTGIAAYLLLRQNEAAVGPCLEAILDWLIYLCGWPDGQLHFFVAPERFMAPHQREIYPYGATDCGLAHGVPGPLAMLALAVLQQIHRPGIHAAIRTTAQWLLDHAYTDPWGINWPYAVTPTLSRSPRESTRTAWCYGSPGVARALWLAGTALRDKDLQKLAIEAMAAVQRRPCPVRCIDSPILCHGVAGLLQIVLRFAHDTNTDLFTDMALTLTAQVLEHFDPGSLAGFCDIEPPGQRVHKADVLEGAAGIALTLLAATVPATPRWDRMFLLS